MAAKSKKQIKVRRDLIKLGKLVNKELYLPEGIRALSTKEVDELVEYNKIIEICK